MALRMEVKSAGEGVHGGFTCDRCGGRFLGYAITPLHMCRPCALRVLLDERFRRNPDPRRLR